MRRCIDSKIKHVEDLVIGHDHLRSSGEFFRKGYEFVGSRARNERRTAVDSVGLSTPRGSSEEEGNKEVCFS